MIGLFDSRVLSVLSRYSCSTNGVLHQSLVVSSGGRIFSGGDDGHLYEVLYYTTSGFLFDSGGLQLVKQTWWFKDLFFDCPTKQQVQSLKLDEARHRLFLLRKSGVIEMFSLGQEGLSRPERVVCIDPCKDLVQASVLALDPVPKHQSKTLALLVTFQDGRRRFYRDLEKSENNQKFKLELAHDLESSEEQQCSLQCMNRSFDGGFWVCPETPEAPRNSHITQFTFNSSMKAEFQELTHSLVLEAPGRPLCIDQYPISELQQTFEDCKMIMDDFHLQLFTKNSKFCLMTREAIIKFDKLHPVRHLRWLLRTKDSNLLVKFVEFYGSVEVAAMCWAIGTDHWDLIEPILAIPDIFQVADFAEEGGSENLERQSLQFESGGDISTLNKLRHSDLFAGFCLYLSRLLKPIWKRPLFTDNLIKWKYDLLMVSKKLVKNFPYF